MDSKCYPYFILSKTIILPQTVYAPIVPKDSIIMERMEALIKTGQKEFLLVYAKDQSQEDFSTLEKTGTLMELSHHTFLNNGDRKLFCKSLKRMSLLEEVPPLLEEGVLHLPQCIATPFLVTPEDEKEILLRKNLLLKACYALDEQGMMRMEHFFSSLSPENLADRVANNSTYTFKNATKAELLTTSKITKRLEICIEQIELQHRMLQQEMAVRLRIQKVVTDQEKQIKHIFQDNNDNDEVTSLKKTFQKQKHELPPHAVEAVTRELKRLSSMNPASSEFSIAKTYITELLDLPWSKKSPLQNDLKIAEATLNKSHFGMTDVKEKILEYLSVWNHIGKTPGTVLCFLGCPGVGKTSVSKSIAKAVGRNFQHLSLGSVKDEAEIRGHRRTYVSALPGKIIQALKKAQTSNPVILLDEIDKIGNDGRVDPTGALLEVLDPEQNHLFADHYIDIPFSLSDCFFICTANSISNIHPALRDRMEIIEIPSYSLEDKIDICKNYLIPNCRQKYNLKAEQFKITPEAIETLISTYTFEAGVRELTRKVEAAARKTVRLLTQTSKDEEIQKPQKKGLITRNTLKEYMGSPPHLLRESAKISRVGCIHGLSYSIYGGDLIFIEVVKIRGGSGKVIATGKLGEMIQESVQAAFSALCAQPFIAKELWKDYNFHLHIPQAGIPKDGPSAGVSIYLALLSSIANVPIRHDIAATGEISLIGEVWPIGGLKEKLLAALRLGIRTVFIPKANERDLEKISKKVKEKLDIRPITHVQEAVNIAMKDVIKTCCQLSKAYGEGYGSYFLHQNPLEKDVSKESLDNIFSDVSTDVSEIDMEDDANDEDLQKEKKSFSKAKKASRRKSMNSPLQDS